MESLIGRLGDALDAYDGQQTANTLQWTRRHLIRAPMVARDDQPLRGLARDHSRRSGMKDAVSQLRHKHSQIP
jgi:hypothetical protein